MVVGGFDIFADKRPSAISGAKIDSGLKIREKSVDSKLDNSTEAHPLAKQLNETSSPGAKKAVQISDSDNKIINI